MNYRIGVDVGSTTTKIVICDDGEMIYHRYVRHFARQRDSIVTLLKEALSVIGDEPFGFCMTGSGARTIAGHLEVPFTQEVVANSIALKREYKKVGTAIELGGQDAKIIFFRVNEKDEQEVFDMRMNGSCAGGTGAFIDEIAVVLGIDAAKMNEMASRGEALYDISGRCGVFAKTDIQPLLNQGARKEDIALSSYHAIAKQTIGGLAQGLDIKPPVAFEGGPLTFHPKLIEVFAQRLGLKEEEILIPESPEIMVAYGAALSIDELHRESPKYRLAGLIEKMRALTDDIALEGGDGELYFKDEKEKEEFLKKHRQKPNPDFVPKKGQMVDAFLGIDAGSTTTKLVLLSRDEEIIDSYYASNEGSPLLVVKRALLGMYDKYKKAGATLNIVATASTGYGEYLMAKAFKTEAHVVETVAHSLSASKYVENPSFILDIGGQDMKAIWLENGIITNIVVNEACSSGCGSFLENFAQTLNIETKDIARRAFESESPAKLGSRCTVFMNSSIITAQRNGKKAYDIMAGLCRSIIENVFTKVIRVANIDSLGKRIVVQGGTFQNDAVLRAMEQYVGREVIRAPYAGLMGAIGAALCAKEREQAHDFKKTFVSYEELRDFNFRQEANSPCPYCANHCNRTILSFSSGDSWVTNNRCEKGAILGDPRDEEIKNRLKEINLRKYASENMFAVRKQLLFNNYPYEMVAPKKETVIGIPRVLMYWEGMPFWTTFWRSLGYQVKISPESTREIYENGLHAVPSDTECFPAKLVHGHIRELIGMGVDRIFMPSISVYPAENTEPTSFSRCALVKGYPIVMHNSDNPYSKYGVKFDAPYFFWYNFEDRQKQLCKYMKDEFDIEPSVTKRAIEQGAKAQESFDRQLKKKGTELIERVERENRYAVVIGARPYHSDPLVNHELPELLVNMGVPVLTVDSIPAMATENLSKSRLDVVNNYHARILSGSIIAAKNPHLEFIQIVSFGCGHDACLSDEAVRMMKEISNKSPLILKVDESDAQGPLRIRVRSFIETIERKRNMDLKESIRPLKDPYLVKFTKEDVADKIVLVPNSSHAFSQIMSAAFYHQKIKAVPLEVGREEAIALGKKYTHNDICFPAQIVIGEAIAALESGKYDTHKVAIAMAKYVCCCRLTHYAALLRKSLDDAGYDYVPIITNDDVDYHRIHPGYRMNMMAILKVAVSLPMIDTLEELLRKIRPYEKVKGSADAAFEKAMDALCEGIKHGGIRGGIKGFRKGVRYLESVEYDRSFLRPTVLIVGEYLMNFHPGANHEIERYLEDNGFEIIEAKMTDVIQKTYFCQNNQIHMLDTKRDLMTRLSVKVTNLFFEVAEAITDWQAKKAGSKFHERCPRIHEIADEADPVINRVFDTGEGILIPGEIIHHANRGCRNFVILQPFGCLPNHVIGRGVIKKFKEMYPDIDVLPLDYDPDLSFANVENRLQMLVMNQKLEIS